MSIFRILLIYGAVPILALTTNKLISPKSKAGGGSLHESGMEPMEEHGSNLIFVTTCLHLFSLYST